MENLMLSFLKYSNFYEKKGIYLKEWKQKYFEGGVEIIEKGEDI